RTAGAGAQAADSDEAGGPDPMHSARMQRASERKKHGGGDDAEGQKSDGNDEERPKSPAEKLEELRALAPGEQGQHIDKMTPEERAQLASTLHQQQDKSELVQVAFDHTPDGEVQTLGQLLAARFGLAEVGPDKLKGDGGKGIEWEAAGLRQAWKVLAM